MGTKNRLMLIASAAAVLLGAVALGLTAMEAVSPSDRNSVARASKKSERRQAGPVSRVSLAKAPACTDPAKAATGDCVPAEDKRLAAIEAHKERWLKEHYKVEIASDSNDPAAAPPSPPPPPQTPEEANARLAEGQQRVVELFPELKTQVDKMNAEIAAERKVVDETGMTKEERAHHMHEQLRQQ